MEKLIKLLIASKLLDDDKTVSLSSILMIVLIAKVALSATLDWPVLSALFITLLSYNSKKLLRLKASKQTAEADKKSAEIDDRLKATLDAHAAQITTVTAQVSQLLSASSVNSVMSQMLGR